MKFRKDISYVKSNFNVPVKQLAETLNISCNHVYYIKHIIRKKESVVNDIFDVTAMPCWITGLNNY